MRTLEGQKRELCIAWPVVELVQPKLASATAGSNGGAEQTSDCGRLMVSGDVEMDEVT